MVDLPPYPVKVFGFTRSTVGEREKESPRCERLRAALFRRSFAGPDRNLSAEVLTKAEGRGKRGGAGAWIAGR